MDNEKLREVMAEILPVRCNRVSGSGEWLLIGDNDYLFAECGDGSDAQALAAVINAYPRLLDLLERERIRYDRLAELTESMVTSSTMLYAALRMGFPADTGES